MSITRSTAFQVGYRTSQGVPLNIATITISGLTAGEENEIPHHLPGKPLTTCITPLAAGDWHESAAPDATNITITIASGGPTAFRIEMIYHAEPQGA